MPDDAQGDPSKTIAALRRELVALGAERDEALAREAAIAEVLQIINSSPGNLAPVFDAILEKATRLCEAACGQIATYDGERFRWVAVLGDAPFVAEQQARGPMPPSFGVTWPRIVGGEGVVNIADLRDTDLYRSGHEAARSGADIGGARSLLSVALRKENLLLGILTIYRQEVRPFTDREIALLQSFAAQAVIAMENARLLTETREALAQQTATAEVLGVINSSPGNLAPVFDAILEKAHSLCGAEYGAFLSYDGEFFRPVAVHGDPISRSPTMREGFRPGFGFIGLVNGERLLHVHDMAEVARQRPDDPLPRALVETSGIRTQLAVPLRKDGKLLGIITANRREVRPFSDKQIALLENFAAQAVIAMENARLLTETREALEQQTATAEVLQVINSSPGDLAPVFDAMLEKASRLCEAAFGSLWTYDGEYFHAVAVRNVPAELAEFVRQPHAAGPNTPLGRVVRTKKATSIQDLSTDEMYRSGDHWTAAPVELGGARSYLAMPLLKDDVLVGAFALSRREVRPFSDQQIGLLENFAAQAVIAMENARLIAETREALDQQTATAEVLQVINSSPGDLAPVFDAILEKARSLCEAVHGALVVYDGEHFRAVATYGLPEPLEGLLRTPFRPNPVHQALLRGERLIHIADQAAVETDTSIGRASVDAGARTLLLVPLRKDGALLGHITASRWEVRPFTDKQIALLENFAAQAVIAMENARLLTETREALEQQTATAEVLQVINSSPGDLAPVFDAILEKAHTLCGAAHGALMAYDGEHFRAVAMQGMPEKFAELVRQPFRPPSGSPQERLLRGERLIHIPDVAAREPTTPIARAAVDAGERTVLFVPLRKDDGLLGYITAHRREVRPFSDKEIALLENFAAQAVIAMENARLITETREALEQQTATAEVLQVINASPGDLAPVFDAMLEKATRLCEASFGILWNFDGEFASAGALHQVPAAYAELCRAPFRPSPGSGPARMMRGEGIFAIVDLTEYPPYRADDALTRAIVDLAGARSVVIAPLRKDAVALGAITLYRQEVRPFSDKQIALLQNFAAQAVIAMENARLLTETREALEQQTATAEVLQVINSSPGDLAPVFDAILEKAHTLCGAAHGALMAYDGEHFRAVAMQGMPEKFAELVRQPFRPPSGSPQERLLRGERLIHIPDVAAREPTTPIARAAVDAGERTVLFVPLRKDDGLLGYITAHRREVRPFSDKEIALLENFAAQAVIAMENARLLGETREALEQQTATAEVLQVINSSPGDLARVFDAMLQKAIGLCDAAHGHFLTYDGDAFHPAAVQGEARFAEYWRQQGSFRPSEGNPLWRLVHGERIVHLADAREDAAYRDVPVYRRIIDIGGIRTSLTVPLCKDGVLLGAVIVYRREVRPFTGKQVALLENFAAQAVIAMENARLLTETREALEQQTATAEVLQVINSSPGDLAPVFDAMLERATRLCEAECGLLGTYDPDGFHGVAAVGLPMGSADALSRIGHPPPGTALGRVERTRETVQIVDITKEPAYAEVFPVNPWLRQMRSNLVVPLLKDGALIGVFILFRREVRPFTDKQIALLQNFAAQAVIAMENARLITETREALEYQTAVGDVLKVISGSAFELQPVLETVVATAVRLCRADQAVIYRNFDGEYRWAAGQSLAPEYERIEREARIRPGPGTLVGRAAAEARTVHILDAWTDPLYEAKDDARVGGAHTMLGVPLLRDGAPIGVIGLARCRIEGYSDKEIELVRTFADQAVIAIENARLIDELRSRTAELGRSVDELRLLSEVGQAVSSTLDLRAVLSTILGRSVGLTGADAGAVFRYNRAERTFRLVEAAGWEERFAGAMRDVGVAEAETAMSEAAARRAPVQLTDLAQRPKTPLVEASLAAGLRSALIVPLVGPERILGALVLQRRIAGEFPAETVRLMQTLASQSVLAIQNARLFREIAEKSEQLALASEHKSQFLANMSHELRTPLNAILGYAELLVDGIYGALPEKAQGVLERVQNNGKHLLALINDVLDLAKIEAGQLALTIEDYSLPELVKTVVVATEPLAAAKGLKFTAAVEDGMPRGQGDARRLAQVLLNLVGNAIKFTDAGEVEIRAVIESGQFVLTVRDTGPGIADADQDRIFGEFQQIDNTNTRKKGGTGLGLAISKRMVEMQGGMITVESVLGQGSTFRVVLPVHVEPALEEAAD